MAAKKKAVKKRTAKNRPMSDANMVDVEAIKIWNKNPKQHDSAAIEASLRKFGFVAPCVMDSKTNQLVAGHGRIESVLSMKSKGEDPPEGVLVEGDSWLIPVRMKKFKNDTERRAYAIADNRLVEIGRWDKPALLDELLLLQKDEFDMESIGFLEKEIALLQEQVSPTPPASFPDVDLDTPMMIRCPKCGYEWNTGENDEESSEEAAV